MRCDIQQLARKGTVNNSSITTLATEGATCPPSPSRRVRFIEPEPARSMRPQYASPRLLRSPAASVTPCLHRRFAAIGRIIVNCQCDRRRVLTPYVLNVDIASMMTQGAAQQL